jgi:mitochondrial import inner membrane translocase subunit TIM54
MSLPSSSGAPASSSVHKSGIRAALEYTGIPPSWLDKRPSVPSRNWLIFWGVTSSILGYYVYDRQQCRRIRGEYTGRVSHLATEPMHSRALPRKVTVYGAKWPGDDDWDRSMRYFRKYVKVCILIPHIFPLFPDSWPFSRG